MSRRVPRTWQPLPLLISVLVVGALVVVALLLAIAVVEKTFGVSEEAASAWVLLGTGGCLFVADRLWAWLKRRRYGP